jgi:NAD-dependent deacetylase
MYEELAEELKKSNNIVFFGGAGVSTESNIPDFRSESGLYNALKKYNYSPETLLSYSFFISNPEVFFDYYINNLIYTEAKPNDAHIALSRLEELGKLKAVITQNIDGLHQMAGSKNVLELHGSVNRNYCMGCGKKYDLSYILESKGIPGCTRCENVVRPDVVLYEEGLDNNVVNKAIKAISKAEVLVIGGTSLAVYPAAGLINYFRGKKLVLINRSKTFVDNNVDIVINEPIGAVLKEVINSI